jgi:hypothetical protein
MAKQTGIILLVGKMGGKSYYYTKDNGYLVRNITSVDAERIRTDPAFARVRENNTDFGRCSWGVKLLRSAFIQLFARAADTHMTSRLTQVLTRSMKADTANAPGMRSPESGDMGLLRGFEFNKETSLKRALKASYSTDVDHERGICTVTITPSNGKLVLQHADAPRFRFVVGVARIDFWTGAHSVEHIRSTEISTRKVATAPMVFTSRIMPVNDEFVFITLGVEYLREVDGDYCVVEDKKYTVLTLVHVEKAPRQPVEKSTEESNKTCVVVMHRYLRKYSRSLRPRVPSKRRPAFIPVVLSCQQAGP